MKILLLLLITLGLIGNHPIEVKRRVAPPPSSFLFYTTSYKDGKAVPKIMVFDSASGSFKDFFSEPRSFLTLLNWSPSGNLLAGFYYQADQPYLNTRLCVFRRDGQLQVCMKETQTYDELINVTWSADESKIYYINGNTLEYKLIEGDTSTGYVLRIVSTFSDTNYKETPIALSPDHKFVIVGARDLNRLGFVRSILLLNVESPTGKIVTELAQQIAVQLSKPQTAEPSYVINSHYLVPCDFSPNGSYITSTDHQIDVNTQGKPRPESLLPIAFTIKDITGVIRYRLDRQPLPVSCPLWNKDETMLYFVARAFDEELNGDDAIYTYDLKRRQVAPFYVKPGTLAIIRDLSLSPDGNYLAFTQNDYPGFIAPDGDPPHGSRVVIVSRDGVWVFSESYPNTRQPIWIPPLTTVK